MATLEQVRWIDFPSFEDERGILTSIEGSNDIPFEIKRVFYIRNATKPRGGHAHKNSDQIFIAFSGSLAARISDSKQGKTCVLNNPQRGLYLPRHLLIELSDFTENAVCLVLTNTCFDQEDTVFSLDLL